MITNVPTQEDFVKSAARFLNVAWSSALGHAAQFRALVKDGAFASDEEKDEYWRSALDDLAVAAGMAHSAAELLLKARIAAVSPYLLLSLRELPGGSAATDTDFAAFRTADAQDLPGLHDTVVAAGMRLSPEFRTKLDSMRRARNRLFHSATSSPNTSATEVILSVAESVHHLVGPRAWIGLRRRALENEPGRGFQYGGVLTTVSSELRVTADLLDPSPAKALFGIDKSRRFYFCPVCLEDCHEWERDSGNYLDGVAQLATRDPSETRLVCAACLTESTVRRSNCSEDSCPGNVIFDGPDDARCLTCATRIEL
jgi:hypothetical protein